MTMTTTTREIERTGPAVVAGVDGGHDNGLLTPLQKFQFLDKYARFDHELGRRETWSEAVTRSVDFLRELSDNRLPETTYREIYRAMHRGDVMPSMRLFAMAGPAARRQHNAIYNCAYVAVDRISTFVEMLTLAMGGTGVGYSVESRYVSMLPMVEPQRDENVLETHVVADSSQGWAAALKAGLMAWWTGYDIEFDFSLVRPMGAPLKTKGGRASGPEPLRRLLAFAREKILSRQGGWLSTLDCHDIATMLGDCVVQGGVRRTAMIALFDANDHDMMTCKDAGNIEGNYHRYNANNSAVWTRLMSREEIESQMMSMHNSGNGEPGIFSRLAASLLAPSRREIRDFGTNPCAEIVLRNRGLCNLSTAIARAEDTEESLKNKVRLAAIIGTIQSAATYFPDLPDEWRKNAEEERLLGVDINGQMDCPLFMRGKQTNAMLRDLREVAVKANEHAAAAIGINPSKAVTCVKPSGNSSTLLDCSPGMHPRHSKYYIRRVRVARASSMYWVFYMQGAKLTPENGQEDMEEPTMYVAEFYVRAPRGALVKGDLSAIEQMDYWKRVKLNYTEHNPSITVTYREEELPDMIDWLHRNQQIVNGMSFLPATGMSYAQAPYEAVSAEDMHRLEQGQVPVNFQFINVVDGGEDYTTAAQELACVAGNCDI